MNLKNRLKQTGEKFYNFYISYWLYLWIIFILTLLNFNFLIIKKFPPPHKIINYIQGIYLGFITFSIPFLWNAYSRILEISKLTVKEIEGILNREFYKKADKLFYIILLVPFTIFILGGLVFSYWLSAFLNVLIILISFLLILTSTKIYRWIENKSKTSLENFIIESPICEDLTIIFEELFKKIDAEIEKEFNLNTIKLMNLFTKKIDEGIEIPENEKMIQKLLSIFQSNLENRLLWVLNISGFWEKLLEWYLKTWDKEETLETFIVIKNIFKNIFEKSLTTHEYYFFMDKFVKHINNCKDKQVMYIDTLLSNFCNIVFEEAIKSPYHISLWDSIPYDWRITSDNLKVKKEDTKIIRIMFHNFWRWAITRITDPGKCEFDKALDEVSYYLFPKTEPALWAEILTFVVLYPRGDMRFIIERPLTFGRIGRVCKDDEWKNEDVDKYRMKDKQEFQQKNETFEITKIIFPEIFKQENIEKYLTEIANLETAYKKDDKQYKRLQRLKRIFEGLKNYEMGN